MDPDLEKRTNDKILQLRQNSEQLVAQLNANSGAIAALETMLKEQIEAAEKADKAVDMALKEATKGAAEQAREREEKHKTALAAAKKIPANAIPPGTPAQVFPKSAVQVTHFPSGKKTPKKK